MEVWTRGVDGRSAVEDINSGFGGVPNDNGTREDGEEDDIIFIEFSKAAMDRRVFDNICNVYQFMNGVTFALPRKEVIV